MNAILARTHVHSRLAERGCETNGDGHAVCPEHVRPDHDTSFPLLITDTTDDNGNVTGVDLRCTFGCPREQILENLDLTEEALEDAHWHPDRLNRQAFLEDTPTPLVSTVPTESGLKLPFPTDALPKDIGDMARTVAASVQVSEAMTGQLALGALSASLGGYVRASPTAGYEEPVNLWTLAVALPGERKSGTINHMMAPLAELERELMEEIKPERDNAKIERRVLEKRIARAEKVAVEAETPTDRADALKEAKELAEELSKVHMPASRRILADDVTQEALVSLMSETRGTLTITSAEGGIFATLAGKYDQSGDNTKFLCGHSGDPIKSDRVGRGLGEYGETIEDPALTVAVMVQPGVLAETIANPKHQASGLLGRFLYCWPESKLGYRNPEGAKLDADAVKRYRARIRKIAIEARKRAEDPKVRNSPRILTLSKEGKKVYLEYAAKTEARLRPGTGDLADTHGWGGKLVGAMVRIAGLLHCAEHSGDVIGKDAVKNAVEIAEFLSVHALRVFGELSDSDPDLKRAELMIAGIKRLAAQAEEKAERLQEQTGKVNNPGAPFEFTIRELFDAARCRDWVKSDDGLPALKRLEEYGWIYPVPAPKKAGRGRRPSPRFIAHPSILAN
ncbi:YfjI family protein [Rhodococcus pyridinivorans]|uniref:YfjI family protein n=1 Tax=Rhodococcus pyridinivorans TaxID=103816 RepID=UPI0036AC7945